jgi:hypothetical protein
MEDDSEVHTCTRTRSRKAKDSAATQRSDTPKVTDRRKARVNSNGLSAQRQHDKHVSQTNGGAFKTCWPFTRVEGKLLEAAHRRETQKQIEEVGEALL